MGITTSLDIALSTILIDEAFGNLTKVMVGSAGYRASIVFKKFRVLYLLPACTV